MTSPSTRRRPTPWAFDAVLFDMAWTLLDSELVWFAVLQAVMPVFGGHLPDGAHNALHRSDRPTSTRVLRERYGLTGDAEAFWARVVGLPAVGLAGARAMSNADGWVEAVAAAGRPRAVV